MDTPQRQYAEESSTSRVPGFLVGVIAGACLGAGLAIWLAPRLASEIGERLTDSARGVSDRAGDVFQRGSERVGSAMGAATRKGQAVRDDVAESVARGAREVERYATAAKTDRA
jgi:gas vesicle protein